MNPQSASPSTSIAPLVAYFENLAPDNLAQLHQHYTAQARFKDPFNDVTGLAEIRRIFEHMFVALVRPRFVVTQQICQGRQCFLTWEFRFGFRNFHKGKEQVILGASHLVLDDQGLVVLHRDYWDAAEELYEKLPGVGSLMRWLKRRANS
jgi:hypothetical protein